MDPNQNYNYEYYYNQGYGVPASTEYDQNYYNSSNYNYSTQPTEEYAYQQPNTLDPNLSLSIGNRQSSQPGPSVPLGYDPGSYLTPEEQKLKALGKFKRKTVKRVAAGKIWEDSSLLEWDQNDFRLFAGDLGNEVNDDTLKRAFDKYPSFIKAKVIRDKRSDKSKGYGFISFKDPNDFARAWKEMNGKYVGNRPIKLRKSTWKERSTSGKGKQKK